MGEYRVNTTEIRDAANALNNQLSVLEEAVSAAERNIEPCRGMLGGRRLTTNLDAWDELKTNLNKIIESMPAIVNALNGTANDIDEVMGG